LLLLITIFTYLLAKELFNQKIGLVSAAFFAFTPSTFLFTKFPSFVDTILLLYLVVAFYFLIKWKNTKKTSYMVIAFIFLGLGFDEKILFIWVFIALISGFIIFRPKFEITIKKIALMAVCTIAGSILFVVRWLLNFDRNLSIVSSKIVTTTQGHENLEVIQNLVSRFDQVYDLLRGSNLVGKFGGEVHTNEFFVIFFFISVIGILLMSILKQNQYSRRSLFFIFAFFVILTVSIFSITSMSSNSLVILLPISAIIMGVFLVSITEKMRNLKKGRKLSAVFFFSILAFLLIGNIIVINDYKDNAEKTGGTNLNSILFSEAGRYLLEQNYSKATTLDASLSGTIFIYSEGKVNINHLRMADNTDARQVKNYKDNFKKSLNDPEMVFLKYNDEFFKQEKRKTLNIINEVLDEENKQFILIKTFDDSKNLFLFTKSLTNYRFHN